MIHKSHVTTVDTVKGVITYNGKTYKMYGNYNDYDDFFMGKLVKKDGTLGKTSIYVTIANGMVLPRVGQNFVQAMETSTASGTTTWYGAATGGGMSAQLPM